MTTKPLSVCLDLSPQLGGLTRGVLDLAAAVGGRIISLDSRPEDPEPWTCNDLIRVAAPGMRFRTTVGRLPRSVEEILDEAISQSSFVIVHSLYRPHLPAIARLCRARQIPYWVVTHGMLDPWVVSRRWLAKQTWLRLFGRPALRDAEVVLFSTAAERDKARPVYAGPNSAVVPWPVETPALEGRLKARAAVRAELGIGSHANVLLWLGRYDSLKRPEHVIKAFDTAKVPGWSLVMAGFPGDVPVERVQAAARRAESRVVVRAAVTGAEKEMLLLGADAFISFSWRENFGYALAEALAAGLPVVAAPDHDLLAGCAGRLWGTRSADHSHAGAVTAIRQLAGWSPHERTTAGQKARAWAAATLGRASFAGRVEALRPRPAAALPIG